MNNSTVKTVLYRKHLIFCQTVKIIDILQYLCRRLRQDRIFNKNHTLNLIADIGNNSAKFFLFNGEQILLHTRRNEVSYDILQEWNRQFGIEKVIVSTVIDLSEQQKELFRALDCPTVWFNSEVDTRLRIEYSTPETLGSDRIAAAVGAWNEKPGSNMLIIDAGSAITIDFVDRQGTYRGGNITPGIKMRLMALHEFTGRLPMVEKEGDTPCLGYSTETAIRSGVIKGICHEIDGYINEIKDKYGDVLVFLTGGDEKTLKNRIKNRIFADKFLVAKGLNRILLDYDWL